MLHQASLFQARCLSPPATLNANFSSLALMLNDLRLSMALAAPPRDRIGLTTRWRLGAFWEARSRSAD